MTGGRVLFIGIDGAAPGLLKEWSSAGLLPNLARLQTLSLTGTVKTLPGMGDGANWPSLVTACSPARHGRYFRIQQKSGSYATYNFETDSDLRVPPFWGQLDDAGLGVEVLDLPFAPNFPLKHGINLSDWMIHDRYGPSRSQPPEFAGQVLARWGDDPIGGDSDHFGRSLPSLHRLRALLLERIGHKTEMVLDRLRSSKADLVMTAFVDMHDIGHVAWHLHDPSHPEYSPAYAAEHGDPLAAVARAIDAAIGRIVEAAGPETAVVIMAGLGMGPNITANNLVPAILARLDGRIGAWSPQFRMMLLRRFRNSLCERIAGKLDWIVMQRQRSISRFYVVDHNDNAGAIRINLEGREPQGRVAAADYDRTCGMLREAFLELRSPETGIPAVSEVVQIAQRPEYSGPLMSSLPDLLVCWNRVASFTSVESDRIGRLDGAASWGRSGDHTPDAWILLRVPGMESRHLCSSPAITDIGPTLAALLGHPLRDVDGLIIPEIAARNS